METRFRMYRPFRRGMVMAVMTFLTLSIGRAWALDIGATIPAFALKSTAGATVSPSDFNNRQVLVVVFAANSCPYSRAYQQRLMKLQQQYQNSGVQFVMINPNDPGKSPDDSFEAMQKRVGDLHYPFPYLSDQSQSVARAFGATRTPEVFVFGPDRKLVYHGTIDDNTEEAQVRVHHLDHAIQATLKGAPGDIQPNTTRAFGCTIKWK